MSEGRQDQRARDLGLRRRLAVPDAGLSGLVGGALGRLWAGTAATFEREMDAGRGFLWLPVLFGTGILVYFALPSEPSLIALAVSLAAAIYFTFDRRRDPVPRRLVIVAAAVLAGVVAAKARTDLVDAPALPHEMTVNVTGWIAAAEESGATGKRVRVLVDSIEGLTSAETPRKVRVTIRTRADSLAVGDPISVLARLSPPIGPVMPGGYDFAFFPYYEQVGGVGFAFGAAKPADLGPPPLSIRLLQPLARLRDAIRKRVEQALPGDDGHIAAALIMGDQRGISTKTQEAMRASGLGHILAISGLHMALVAGSVFWLIRALLALSPALALNYAIKKWAAVGALIVATIYLGISGAGVSTLRAWVMLTIMLVAVLLDRRALTLRNVALAALVILVFTPESLLSISFQMSFAATVALVAAYQALAARADRASLTAGDHSFFGRVRRSAGALFLTSLVAGLATTPFAIFYFQRLAPLTLVANMAAAPVVGFVVMPMALLSVLAMPFGLEVYPLHVMQWGLAWLVGVAERTAAWSAGLGAVPMPPAAAILLAVAGFLWLTLWWERWRFAGVVPMAAAMAVAAFAPRPDVLVDDAASAVALRGADGRLSILGGKGARFEISYWLRADADPRPPDDASLASGTACDPLGCVGRASGQTIAFARSRDAFADDCREADVVISALPAPKGCAARALVIDRSSLGRYGAHALYRDGDGFKVVTAYPAVRRPFMPPAQIP